MTILTVSSTNTKNPRSLLFIVLAFQLILIIIESAHSEYSTSNDFKSNLNLEETNSNKLIRLINTTEYTINSESKYYDNNYNNKHDKYNQAFDYSNTTNTSMDNNIKTSDILPTLRITRISSSTSETQETSDNSNNSNITTDTTSSTTSKQQLIYFSMFYYSKIIRNKVTVKKYSPIAHNAKTFPGFFIPVKTSSKLQLKNYYSYDISSIASLYSNSISELNYNYSNNSSLIVNNLEEYYDYSFYSLFLKQFYLFKNPFETKIEIFTVPSSQFYSKIKIHLSGGNNNNMFIPIGLRSTIPELNNKFDIRVDTSNNSTGNNDNIGSEIFLGNGGVVYELSLLHVCANNKVSYMEEAAFNSEDHKYNGDSNNDGNSYGDNIFDYYLDHQKVRPIELETISSFESLKLTFNYKEYKNRYFDNKNINSSDTSASFDKSGRFWYLLQFEYFYNHNQQSFFLLKQCNNNNLVKYSANNTNTNTKTNRFLSVNTTSIDNDGNNNSSISVSYYDYYYSDIFVPWLADIINAFTTALYFTFLIILVNFLNRRKWMFSLLVSVVLEDCGCFDYNEDEEINKKYKGKKYDQIQTKEYRSKLISKNEDNNINNDDNNNNKDSNSNRYRSTTNTINNNIFNNNLEVIEEVNNEESGFTKIITNKYYKAVNKQILDNNTKTINNSSNSRFIEENRKRNTVSIFHVNNLNTCPYSLTNKSSNSNSENSNNSVSEENIDLSVRKHAFSSKDLCLSIKINEENEFYYNRENKEDYYKKTSSEKIEESDNDEDSEDNNTNVKINLKYNTDNLTRKITNSNSEVKNNDNKCNDNEVKSKFYQFSKNTSDPFSELQDTDNNSNNNNNFNINKIKDDDDDNSISNRKSSLQALFKNESNRKNINSTRINYNINELISNDEDKSPNTNYYSINPTSNFNTINSETSSTHTNFTNVGIPTNNNNFITNISNFTTSNNNANTNETKTGKKSFFIREKNNNNLLNSDKDDDNTSRSEATNTGINNRNNIDANINTNIVVDKTIKANKVNSSNNINIGCISRNHLEYNKFVIQVPSKNLVFTRIGKKIKNFVKNKAIQKKKNNNKKNINIHSVDKDIEKDSNKSMNITRINKKTRTDHRTRDIILNLNSFLIKTLTLLIITYILLTSIFKFQLLLNNNNSGSNYTANQSQTTSSTEDSNSNSSLETTITSTQVSNTHKNTYIKTIIEINYYLIYFFLIALCFFSVTLLLSLTITIILNTIKFSCSKLKRYLSHNYIKVSRFVIVFSLISSLLICIVVFVFDITNMHNNENYFYKENDNIDDYSNNNDSCDYSSLSNICFYYKLSFSRFGYLCKILFNNCVGVSLILVLVMFFDHNKSKSYSKDKDKDTDDSGSGNSCWSSLPFFISCCRYLDFFNYINNFKFKALKKIILLVTFYSVSYIIIYFLIINVYDVFSNSTSSNSFIENSGFKYNREILDKSSNSNTNINNYNTYTKIEINIMDFFNINFSLSGILLVIKEKILCLPFNIYFPYVYVSNSKIGMTFSILECVFMIKLLQFGARMDRLKVNRGIYNKVFALDKNRNSNNDGRNVHDKTDTSGRKVISSDKIKYEPINDKSETERTQSTSYNENNNKNSNARTNNNNINSSLKNITIVNSHADVIPISSIIKTDNKLDKLDKPNSSICKNNSKTKTEKTNSNKLVYYFISLIIILLSVFIYTLLQIIYITNTNSQYSQHDIDDIASTLDSDVTKKLEENFNSNKNSNYYVNKNTNSLFLNDNYNYFLSGNQKYWNSGWCSCVWFIPFCGMLYIYVIFVFSFFRNECYDVYVGKHLSNNNKYFEKCIDDSISSKKDTGNISTDCKGTTDNKNVIADRNCNNDAIDVVIEMKRL